MPSGGIAGRNGTPEERFWKRVFKTENCWFWTGGCKSDGYGCMKINGRMESAHVFSFRIHLGEIPEGNHILHRCDIPQCVRPDHLYAGTHRENMLDRKGGGTMGHQVFRTHCPMGHEYTPENTFIWKRNGHRSCRVCHKDRQKALRAKEKHFESGNDRTNTANSSCG